MNGKLNGLCSMTLRKWVGRHLCSSVKTPGDPLKMTGLTLRKRQKKALLQPVHNNPNLVLFKGGMDTFMEEDRLRAISLEKSVLSLH